MYQTICFLLQEKTLTFLKSSVSDLSNTYSTALLAYTFSLAGEEDLRSQLLKHLDSVATSDGMKHFSVPEETQITQRFNLLPLSHVAHVFSGSLLHWSQSSSERADSLAVETSSYVLLAVLSKTTLTAADLGYAARIVNWLVKQQNPYGGFSSTQVIHKHFLLKRVICVAVSGLLSSFCICPH